MGSKDYAPAPPDENHQEPLDKQNDDDTKSVGQHTPAAVGIWLLLTMILVFVLFGGSILEIRNKSTMRGQISITEPLPSPNPLSTSSTGTSSSSCHSCPPAENENDVCDKVRQKHLASVPPHINECAPTLSAGLSCRLPQKDRFDALGQKGATLWLTGCSGAGKTSIATALEDKLIKEYGKHVYRLDGDNLRTGLNRDLGFSEADRAESVRRTGELATLFSDAGIITVVGLVSPYRADRDAVRKRHEDQGIPFYEVFLDVLLEDLNKRDPKGVYSRIASGELKHFTCIDDPYEPPLLPEITLKTHELEIKDSVEILFDALERDGVLVGGDWSP